MENSKDQLQSRIDSLSTNIEINRCLANKSNVVLEGELERFVSERDRPVADIENSIEYQNTNQVSAESLKSENDQKKQ